jgi:hypothetical protein
MPDVQLSHEIQRWLDRDVNCELGFEPDACITSVPRIRGVKSKFAQVSAAPVIGQRLRQYWRQREALVRTALVLLYSTEQIDAATEQGLEITSELFEERLAKLKLQRKNQ